MTCPTSIRLNTGQMMPIIGLGTGNAPQDTMRNALRVALEHGYRSIDTAYLYMNEETIGDVLQEFFSKGQLKREDVFVTSKLPAIANRPEDVHRFLTMSLKKLKLDYLDLYLIHHPFGLIYFDDLNVFGKNADGETDIDFDTDIESLWKSLEKEVKSGRVKSLGVYNFNSFQIDKILNISEYPPAVNQVEVHAYFPQHDLIEFCHRREMAVVGYCPLGGPWTAEGKNLSLLEDPTVGEIAKKLGKAPGQILLRYLVQRNVIVVPKSNTTERIKSNFDIMDFELSKEDMEKMLNLDKGEKGRIFHFTDVFKGCEDHKEYPFHIKF